MTDRAGVLDSFHLGEALKPTARKLGERCGHAAVSMLARRFVEFTGPPEDDRYSYIWRAAIEDHEQDAHKDDFRAVIVDAIRDAALGATGRTSDEAMTLVRDLLESGYPTLVRIGIYVCGEHYGTVGPVFWECVKQDWLLEVAYWHELYWFVGKAAARFSASERARYLAMVDAVHGDYALDERQDELDDSHRRDLLHPAVGQGDTEIDAKYQALVAKWGPVREHPDFHSYTTSGWVGERSPVTTDALVAMSEGELRALFASFVPDPNAWDGPTYRGLASTISAAVRASEDGFATRIQMFADLARPYQHGLLRGLKERWSDDKREIDWPETLSLVSSIVAAPTFKTDLEAEGEPGWVPTVQWVIGDIADLMKSGASVERQLAPVLLIRGLEVLRLILSSAAPTKAGDSMDAVSHAINAPRGRALEAFINVALALRRQEVATGVDDGQTWGRVFPVFEEELRVSEVGGNADFAALAGTYCANLHFMNAQWVEDNFDRLFSTSNDSAWRCAAQGFAYQRHLYDWLYRKLIASGHLRRMVFAEGLPDSVSEKSLQFLGLAYLEGLESIDANSLLHDLVVDLRVKELSQLCWFFWTLRGSREGAPERVKLILEFWGKVATAIRASGEAHADLQSALSVLAVFIDNVTPEIEQALVDAAPHAQVRHHGYILVENLSRLASKQPVVVANVFRAALTGFIPDYRGEDVVACVKALAHAGRIEDAESICNMYAKHGSTLLKESYDSIREMQRSQAIAARDDN